MTGSGRPLLSLCIPTYNRAGMLELMLGSLCEQVAALQDEVEIVVSDNCSTDRTPEVIAEASTVCPISVFRNDHNVGQRNFLVSVERARGEYAWVLGDDDLVLAGGLARVVRALREHPDLDYFYVNYFLAPVPFRDDLIREQASSYRPPFGDWIIRAGEDRSLASWEHIFDLPSRSAILVNTSILSSVFRREPWLRCAGLLRMSGSPMVSAEDNSLDDLFPHVKVLAHAMIGRPGWLVAEPCALMGQGRQEWHSDWPVIAIVGTNEALDLYERLGVAPERMKRLWRSHFSRAAQYMPMFGSRRDAPCMDGFPWAAYLLRNRRHLDQLGVVLLRRAHPGSWLRERLPRPVYTAARRAWRAAGRGSGARQPGGADPA